MADEEQMQQEEPTEQYTEENGGAEQTTEEQTEAENQLEAVDDEDDEDDRLDSDIPMLFSVIAQLLVCPRSRSRPRFYIYSKLFFNQILDFNLLMFSSASSLSHRSSHL